MKSFKKFLLKEVEQTQAGNFFFDFLNYKSDVYADDVTIEFLEKLKEYCLERVSPNSARVYLGYFKRAFYKASKLGFEFKSVDYDDVLRYLFVREEASEHIFVSASELKMLEQYEPISDVERFVRAVFLLCSYTGIRASDYPLITEANFRGNELQYTANKNKVSATMPLHPLVPSLIEELREFNHPPQIATSMIGQYIKTIFKKIGLNEVVTLYQRGKHRTSEKWRFISSHTARRSYCTNLYLDGYSVQQIQRMVGHSNSAQTESYIVSSYADNIMGNKIYLTPDRDNDAHKLEAIKIQMMANLGLSEVDAQAIVEGMKDKIS